MKNRFAIFVTTVIFALLYPKISALAATRTWDGGGTNSFWMNATNWDSDIAPLPGDDLVFPGGAAQLSAVNNFPAGTTFNSIIIGGAYSISGQSIALNAGIRATNGTGTTIYNSLILNSNQTFTLSVGSANFFLPTAINLNGNDLTFSVGPQTIAQVQAVIGGVGGLIKTNTGALFMYASNSFNGPVQVFQGSLSIYDGHALGSTNANTTVAAGAFLSLANSSITVVEPIVVSGTLSGGTVTLTAPLTLLGIYATIQVPSGESFNINGVISGDDGFTKIFPGILTLNSNNTYAGTTTINGGLLRVQGSQPGNPIVLNAGALGGTGAVGNVTVSTPDLNVIAPGASPGILTCSNITLQSSTSVQVEIYGAALGSDYDQLHVQGTVALNNANLAINAIDFAMSGNAQFTLIDNDGSDPINGNFAGLPEGATVNVGTNQLKITYMGGTGNDVVLYQGNPPSRLTAITSATNGAKQILGMGLSNLTYTIQAVTNLNPPITWANLGPATADNSGVFSFIDTNAPLFPMRFYRAQSP